MNFVVVLKFVLKLCKSVSFTIYIDCNHKSNCESLLCKIWPTGQSYIQGGRRVITEKRVQSYPSYYYWWVKLSFFFFHLSIILFYCVPMVQNFVYENMHPTTVDWNLLCDYKQGFCLKESLSLHNLIFLDALFNQHFFHSWP